MSSRVEEFAGGAVAFAIVLLTSSLVVCARDSGAAEAPVITVAPGSVSDVTTGSSGPESEGAEGGGSTSSAGVDRPSEEPPGQSQPGQQALTGPVPGRAEGRECELISQAVELQKCLGAATPPSDRKPSPQNPEPQVAQ